ncbi:NHLP family bacteriocin export ABC transporter peptidase/permease/ATPase subunit [Tistlia consotensis]|uniref:NHLP family bacteriocin export ABC transporter peptidase/permease/ATPase subunit n=1 Tax=Tistlia consotensis TaxID=1321365 RepID=UPI00135659BF|nr:NHLP family bacteriocin export ABC transporter peptidase/permease/ATPase subunit [Tistlia consotensis]
MSVPTLLQTATHESGAAALGMVLAHYGKWLPLERLCEETGVSRDGSRAENITAAAHNLGLEAQQRGDGAEAALRLPTPALVQLDSGFAVLEGSARGRVWLNDPASGRRSLSPGDFAKHYAGAAITLRPAAGFRREGHGPNLVTSLGRHLGGARGATEIVLLVTVLLVVPGLLLPGLLKVFIDEVLIKQLASWLLPLIIGLALSGLLDALLLSVQQFYLKRLQIAVAIGIAGGFLWHLLRLPVQFFGLRTVGDVVARYRSSTQVSDLLAESVSTNLLNLVMVAFFGPLLFLFDVQLAAVAVALTLLNIGAVQLARGKRAQLNRRQLNEEGKLTAAGMGGLKAIETLKAMGTEPYFFRSWAQTNSEVVDARQEVGRISLTLDAVPAVLNALTIASMLGFGAILVIRGAMSVGDLIAFQWLLKRFSQPMQQLVTVTQSLQLLQSNLRRIDDVLAYPGDPLLAGRAVTGAATAAPEPRLGDGSPSLRLSGALSLKDVGFSYSPVNEPLIQHFDLELEPGARVALVGGSGSGKSTLGKLIVGLYRPTEGQVLFDGLPIDRIPRALFLGSIGYVDQDIFLFNGTVRENITMWDSSIPIEAVRRAAGDACIDDIVSARIGAYDSQVAEGGVNFSGGQRQRIEIARALVREPRLVVLDEATAALDAETERQIDDNLRRRGCTCVIIAHRLSTIRDADEIIVLDRGRVIERGRHDELIARKGRYAELVAMA